MTTSKDLDNHLNKQVPFTRSSNRLRPEIYNGGYWYFVTICVQERECIFGEVESEVKDLSLINGFNQSADNQDNDVAAISDRHSFQYILKQIVNDEIELITSHFENVILDEYVIMPNHVHLIIGLNSQPVSTYTGKPSNLGNIIKRFKIESNRKIVLCLDKWRSEIAATNAHNYNPNDYEEGADATNKSQSELTITNNENKIYLQKTKYLLNTYDTIWQKSYYDHVIRNDKDLDRAREYVCNNPKQWELDGENPGKKSS